MDITKPTNQSNQMSGTSILPQFSTGGEGGVFRISSDRDNQRIFGGFKFSILGFFWVGKFGKYFFGQLDLSRVFLRYSKLMFLVMCDII